ncbi:MAG: hypothetical protein ACAI35_00650 [Candidatus Methylacidiphilales bacterium]|nr:hypothetical protein [Candidatus Methylacidiphilales bacterium]
MRIPASVSHFPLCFLRAALPGAVLMLLACACPVLIQSLHAQGLAPAPARVPGQAPLPAPSAAAVPEPQERKMPGLRFNPDMTPPPPEVAESINGFFAELKNGAAEKAYDVLLANTRIKERRDQVQALVSRTGQAMGLYGRVQNAEMYDNRRLGTRLIVLTYLSYSEIQPLRWRFVYYKPGATWIMINLDCDDKLSSWYE